MLPEPSTKLEFTGERLTRAVGGQIELEHFHRYCIARDLCCQLDVLDVASGEGYGSVILATVAKTVKGVDIDQSAIAYSKSEYKLNNLEFLHGSALALPIEDVSVDVVVSFETLEHIQEHHRFLAEVKRVLRPGGRFLVSTPDRAVYSAQHFNQFHKLELNEDEFRSVLRSSFTNVELIKQRAILGSLVASPISGAWRSYERRHPEYIEASGELSRATYLIGMASDAELLPLASSAYFDLRAPWEAADALLRIGTVEKRATELEHDCVRTRTQLVEANARAAEFVRRQDESQSALADAKAMASELARERDEYKESLMWERALIAERETQLEEVRCSLFETKCDLERSDRALDESKRDLEKLHWALDESKRVLDESTRQIASLVKNQPTRVTPRELKQLSRFLPGKRKEYKRCLRDYLIVSRSPLFDADWYLSKYKDVRDGKIDPVLHYIKHGAKEGRVPGPRFDGAKYLEANPDVLMAGLNPLVHYVTVGHAELRPLEKARQKTQPTC
jgi:ubiquinone/menaquinone biosynthesis C-methylase UbiE